MKVTFIRPNIGRLLDGRDGKQALTGGQDIAEAGVLYHHGPARGQIAGINDDFALSRKRADREVIPLRAGPIVHVAAPPAYFFCSFFQVSRRLTVRLKTGRSGVLSTVSGMK